MNKWISVRDRLPDMEIDNLSDPLDDVLILFQRKTSECEHCSRLDGYHHFGIGYVVDDEWRLSELLDEDCFPNDYEEQIKVTHWMLLPELPPCST